MSSLHRFVRRVLGRADQGLPAAVADRARQFVRLVGDRPVIGSPAGRHLVVLAPHPDDETIMCGGTIAAHTAGGDRVTLIAVTDGESGGDPTLGEPEAAATRRVEQEKAAACLGIARIIRLGLRDGAVADHAAELMSALDAILRENDVDAVFTPWWLDGHPDHEAVARTLAAAVPDHVEVWAAEVWTPLIPNRIVDVTAHIETKRAAIRCYETASRAVDLDALAALSRYRTVFGLRGKGYAEAFIALTAEGYRAAVAAYGR